MDVRRSVKTGFWSDDWIETLDPIERLLFLYLLTNPQTNIVGVYELSVKRMAFETGIEQEVVIKILGRFQDAGKIIYTIPYIIVRNWIINNPMNRNMKKCAIKIIYSFSNSIQEQIKGLEEFKSLWNGSEPLPNHSEGLSNGSEPLPNHSEGLGNDLFREEKEKEKEKNSPRPPLKEKNQKEKKESIAPSQQVDSQPASDKITFDFNSRTWKNIMEEDFRLWGEAYPGVNFEIELSKAANWLVDDPKRKKINYRKFLTNWFSKAQDSPGYGKARQGGFKPSGIFSGAEAVNKVKKLEALRNGK